MRLKKDAFGVVIEELAQIEIRAGVAGNDSICAVHGNGVGFEPEYGHRLFGILQRLCPAS